MMIVISAIEAGECVVLNSDSQLVKENTRRLSRSATLDGGAVMSDGGVFGLASIREELQNLLPSVNGKV